MIITKPDYYDHFHCLANACPDTCCANWEVIIDSETVSFYESVHGKLGEQLHSAMTIVDGETCFGLHNGLCQLLQPDGLCTIQKELGEEHLCKICSSYPRFSTEIGVRRSIGISLSCPEAARLILTANNNFNVVQEQTNEPMTSLHELSPALIIAINKLQKISLKIAQNEQIPFSLRCAAIIRLCAPVHKEAKAHHDVLLESALNCGLQAAESPITPAKEGGLAHFRASIQKAFFSLETLRPEWKQYLNQAANLQSSDWDTICPSLPKVWEQLLCYSIYKYFPRTVFDRNIQSAAVFSVLLPLLLRQLMIENSVHDELSLLSLAWNLSREIEHSEFNMTTLWQSFSCRAFRPEAVSAVLAAL